MTEHPHAKDLAWEAIPIAEADLPAESAEVEVMLMSSSVWFGSEVYVEVSTPGGRCIRVEIAEDDDVQSLVSKISAAIADANASED